MIVCLVLTSSLLKESTATQQWRKTDLALCEMLLLVKHAFMICLYLIILHDKFIVLLGFL